MKNKIFWVVEFNYKNGEPFEFRFIDTKEEAEEFAKTVNGKVQMAEWIK